MLEMECYNKENTKHSSELKKIGVISAKDLTTETAITKLMFLLGVRN